jgi:hypothetical protein
VAEWGVDLLKINFSLKYSVDIRTHFHAKGFIICFQTRFSIFIICYFEFNLAELNFSLKVEILNNFKGRSKSTNWQAT